MWQRIQTVYLTLATITLLLMMVFPIASYMPAESEKDLGFVVNITGITLEGDEVKAENLEGMEDELAQFFLIGKIGLMALCIFIVAIVFLYKKRPLQIKLSRLAMILVLLLIVILVFGVDQGATLLADRYLNGRISAEDIDVGYGTGFFMPVAALAFLFLAIRGMKKDEKLVKAVDRIR